MPAARGLGRPGTEFHLTTLLLVRAMNMRTTDGKGSKMYFQGKNSLVKRENSLKRVIKEHETFTVRSNSFLVVWIIGYCTTRLPGPQ